MFFTRAVVVVVAIVVVGIVAVVPVDVSDKLTGFFMDAQQLDTILMYTQAVLDMTTTATTAPTLTHSGMSVVEKSKRQHALLRVLSIIGESTKYLTAHTKGKVSNERGEDGKGKKRIERYLK